MRVHNSRRYEEAPFEMTAQDLAILFDMLNIGVRKQMEIVDDIWEHYRWILPSKYRGKNRKKKFQRDVLYQVNYLYQKDEIDDNIEVVEKNASEYGIAIKREDLTAQYNNISEYFKGLWLRIHYINSSDFARAKLRTILKQYNYERRSERFCAYFEECIYYYKLDCTVKGKAVDIRSIPLDTMITFRARRRRKRKARHKYVISEQEKA